MDAKELFFATVKEDRVSYFVEYHPARLSFHLALLQLTYPHTVTPTTIAIQMESELKSWLTKYPIPLMVSSFDEFGDLIDLEGVRPCKHLMGFVRPQDQSIEMHWRLLKNHEMGAITLDEAMLKQTYFDINCKTSDDLRKESIERGRKLRLGRRILFVWLVCVPAAIAIFEWAGPGWVAALALIYSLWKALVQGLKMSGKWKKSSCEIAREKEELQMRHHHYHCKRNPDAFLKLKIANFEQDEKERIQAEARSLKDIASRKKTA
jgi:hypothetical protein